MIVLRAIKVFTSCTSIEQTLFKQIVTEDEVLDLHRVDELKNFAANNLL